MTCTKCFPIYFIFLSVCVQVISDSQMGKRDVSKKYDLLFGLSSFEKMLAFSQVSWKKRWDIPTSQIKTTCDSEIMMYDTSLVLKWFTAWTIQKVDVFPLFLFYFPPYVPFVKSGAFCIMNFGICYWVKICLRLLQADLEFGFEQARRDAILRTLVYKV